jgi:hypothetical protein
MPAGWGTDHVGFGQCKLHGGATRGNRVASAREELAAVTTGRFMGTPIEVDPATAMLMCVQVAAGHVDYATRQVAAVPESEGIVEFDYGGQLHPWARIQAEAMDRLVRYSKMAVECGAEVSAVRFAERQGAALAQVIEGVLDAIELTDEQRARVPEVLSAHLLSLEATHSESILGGSHAGN